MFDEIPVRRADVARLVNATFPEYRGRRFVIEARETVTLHDLNWSGGTRNQYRTATLDGQAVGQSDRYNRMAPWENPAEGCTLQIPSGFVVVCRRQFQGRERPLAIYAHPRDLAALLPARKAA